MLSGRDEDAGHILRVYAVVAQTRRKPPHRSRVRPAGNAHRAVTALRSE